MEISQQNEQFEYPLPILRTNIEKIVVGTTADGFFGDFIIKNVGGGTLSGHIMSNNSCISFESETFENNHFVVQYKIRLDEYKNGDIIHTSIIIVSNGGEKILQVYIKVIPPAITMTDGTKIASLKDFYAYYKKFEQRALSLFCSSKFKIWLKDFSFPYVEIYDELLKDEDKNRAILNFFALSKLKTQTPTSKVESVEKLAKVSAKSFEIELNKQIFANNETGKLSITNNTKRPLEVEIETKDNLIKFAEKRYVIEKTADVLFSFKQNAFQIAQLAIKKQPCAPTSFTLNIKANGKWIKKTVDIIVGEGVLVNYRKSNVMVANMVRALVQFEVDGESEKLHVAKHTVLSALNAEPQNVALRLCAIYLHIISGGIDTATELLTQINAHKNYYKAENGLVFSAINFLFALIELDNGKSKAANKYLKILQEDESEFSGFSQMFSAAILIEMDMKEQAFLCILKSLENGCNSGFLLACAYRCYENYKEFAIENNKQFFLFSKIYNSFGEQWVLIKLCEYLISVENLSVEAFEIYKKAQKLQLQIIGLDMLFVRCCAIYGDTNLSRFTVQNFINSDYFNQTKDVGLKLFLYHVILCDKKFEDIVHKLEVEIVDFAFYCVINNVKSYYLNAIFRHSVVMFENVHENFDAKMYSKRYIESMESLLWAKLFGYNLVLEDENVSLVWIYEKEKMFVESVEIANKTAVITPSSHHATLFFFSQTDMAFVNCDVKLTKEIENSDISLLIYFYRRGKRSIPLLIALSKHIIYAEKPLPEALEILTETVKLKEISQTFRTQVSAALANVLYTHGTIDLALSYYNDLDENCLNDKYIEQMLRVFVENKEFLKAIKLINKKGHCIFDRSLFEAVKQIAMNDKYKHMIADTAYELVLKSWYDPIFVEIILEFYKGSQQEWQELSKTLSNMQASSERLDELILKNSIWIHKLDKETQNVFNRMFEQSPENAYISAFAYYCMFEIVVNRVSVESQTLNVLETIFKQSNELFLGYALCIIYYEFGIKSDRCDEITSITLKLMEKNGLLFPEFKQFKDKCFQIPYIIKNMPFIYRCAPNKNVFVTCVVDERDEAIEIAMQYTRFGFYFAKMTHFYNEKIVYSFSEKMVSGSIVTKQQLSINESEHLSETINGNTDDLYFKLNDALIYAKMFKFEQTEAFVVEQLKENKKTRGNLI